ncbi:MAG: 2-amino-4-hydroxy-6-hydroxymethyldihydropteridine diphosphokinase [Nitrospinae bacterium]|nr:2-amino-4-hydroxy-6-hydroxymethyldihydropteridine diphosphokinase [Nitrospinota bacterium]
MIQPKHIAYIGIGSNVGDLYYNCLRAIEELTMHGGNRIVAESSLYKTEPIGYTNQRWFINCVVGLETPLGAKELLLLLKDIEVRLWRRKRLKWGPREIDIDLLLFDNQVINDTDLIVPHPEMEKRRFVLAPLSEITSDLIHPVMGVSIKDLLDSLGDSQRVEVIKRK